MRSTWSVDKLSIWDNCMPLLGTADSGMANFVTP